MRCYCIIDLNLHSDAKEIDPGDYRWSSDSENALGQHDPLVHPHANTRCLSSDPEQRLVSYAALVMAHVSPMELDAILEHRQRQHA